MSIQQQRKAWRVGKATKPGWLRETDVGSDLLESLE